MNKNINQIISNRSNITMTITLANSEYQVDINSPLSLAIVVHFNQACEQPNHFGAQTALSVPMQAGDFIGDTKRGGSCNVNELSINPHCNGTHTESIAHICDFTDSAYVENTDVENAGTENADIEGNHQQALTISQLNLPPLMPCAVISITPELAVKSGDDYSSDFGENDFVFSQKTLEQALVHYDDEQLQTLVIRSLPNDPSKCQQIYNSENQPVFFSRTAILYLNERGIEHLVVDVPSIDRLHDDGLMTCHHLFWQVPAASHHATKVSLVHKTITEMAFINDEIDDGFYFINIQTPAFHNDAAPSRPLLFRAKEMNK